MLVAGEETMFGRTWWRHHDVETLLRAGFCHTPHARRLARRARRKGLLVNLGPRERVLWPTYFRCVELLRPDGTRSEDAVASAVLDDYGDAYTSALARVRDLKGDDRRPADYLLLLEQHNWHEALVLSPSGSVERRNQEPGPLEPGS